MPSTDFETEREAFKEYYSAHSTVLNDAADSLRTLISLLLTDCDAFATPQVTARVKDRDECIAKFTRKYQKEREDAGTPYEIKDSITELVGLRVVCLYESDVPLVREILGEAFVVIDETDKAQTMESQEAAFGYKGVHLDIRLDDQRRELPEYRRFRDLRFEVQLRTIVQDAWSVLDHKIKYKKNIPHALKRRINRLAALFELADQEFLNIRDETRQLELTAAQAPATTELVPTPGTLDAFSFLTLMKQRHPNYAFIDLKRTGILGDLISWEDGVYGTSKSVFAGGA